MYGKTGTLSFLSLVTLLVIVTISSISPSTKVLATQVVQNSSTSSSSESTQDDITPFYSSRSELEEDSNSNTLSKRIAVEGIAVDRISNARSFTIEHGLRPVKRHHKKNCSSSKSKKHHHHHSHSHSSSTNDDSNDTNDTNDSTKITGTNYDSISSSKKGSKKSQSDSSNSQSDSSNTTATSSSSSSSSSSSGSGPYSRVQSNRGSNFWSGDWDFWTYSDPTHGRVAFASESSAKKQGLIGSTSSGAAYMRTSNKDISSGNRPSVRFQSKKAYDSGLVIFDVVKMPVGCATWPALWTTKGSNWPHNGEIDVVEGVGYTAGGKNANQMTVHLAQNSPLQLNRRGNNNNKRGVSYLGKVMQGGTNCNQYGSGNTGCAFFDSNKNGPSWGKAFNSAGGGIWAMQFGNGGGVKIWFWGRKSGKIPDELAQPNVSPKKLNPSSWGTPMANFQNSAINNMIKGQNIIMDITIGGDWAGNVAMDGNCKGQSLNAAIKKGSNYDDAEFIINAIDVYCKNGTC